MKATVLLTAILSLCLAGCAANAAKVTKATVTPPAPVQPPPPLSIPQTHVELPEVQRAEDAAFETELPTPPVAAPAAPTPPRTVPPPKPPRQPAHDLPQPAAQPPPAGPPAEAARPAIEELIAPVEANRLQASAQARRAEASRILQQLGRRRLSQSQQQVAASIRNFLALSQDSEKHNDMRQADALAERAQILAKELQSGN